jgi:hypothetical protein
MGKKNNKNQSKGNKGGNREERVDNNNCRTDNCK